MPVEPNITGTKATHPFTFACDKPDCYWRTAHKTAEDAATMENIHITGGCMPLSKSYLLEETDERGQRYTALHMGKSIVEKLWDELDARLDELYASSPDDQMGQTLIKGQCITLTSTIQLMLAHYYPDRDAVTREAMKRRKIRQGEIPFEPTSGYQYNPPPVGSSAYAAAQKRMAPDTTRSRTPSTGTRRGPARQTAMVEPHLDEETIAGIRHALSMGFPAEDLAGMYKTTAEHIKRVGEVTS